MKQDIISKAMAESMAETMADAMTAEGTEASAAAQSCRGLAGIWKMIRTLLLAGVITFLATTAIYWFNLDTKAVKLLEPFMTKHYDELKRDRKL